MGASSPDRIAKSERALSSASPVAEGNALTRIFDTFVAVNAVGFSVAAGVFGLPIDFAVLSLVFTMPLGIAARPYGRMGG